MLGIIKDQLLRIVKDIDAGNSNINEDEAIKLISLLREYNRKDIPLSKYSACQYLNISRATFDNLIREGKLPKGNKLAGFKELMWTKKDLDLALKKLKPK